MKKLLKKIVSVFAVAAMAASMPLSVSADELENFSNEEEVMVNDISVSANTASSRKADKFFTVLTANEGQKISNEISAYIEYGLTYDNPSMRIDGFKVYNDCINTATAVLNTSKYVPIDPYYIYSYGVILQNLGTQTTSYGNIVKFNISLTGNETGVDGYKTIAYKSCLRLFDEDSDDLSIDTLNCRLPISYEQESSYHHLNYNVGGYGDVAYQYGNQCGVVDNTDLYYVRRYLDNKYSLNPLQKVAADVDNDGVVTENDYNMIKAYISGDINF